MYSLMIVEDELLARLALKNSIAWEKYNITTILEARDGMEALEKFRNEIPDILIVDINIPLLNGMELIKEIRKENQTSKIIILSCLEDFNYATEAMKEGVSEYILKASMSIEEIEGSIKKLVQELQNKRGIAHYPKSKNTEEYQEKNVLLRKLLNGECGFAEQDQTRLNESYLIAIFKVEFRTGKHSDLSQELLNKMNFVKNIIVSTIQEVYPCQVVVLPTEYYVAYIEEKKGTTRLAKNELKHLLENTVHLIQKYTSSKVVVGVSDKQIGQNTVFQSFQLAKKRLGYYAFDEKMLYLEESESFLEQVKERWKQEIQKVEEETSIVQMMNLSSLLESVPTLSDTYLDDIKKYWISMMNKVSFWMEKERKLDTSEELLQFVTEMQTCKKQSDALELFLRFARTIETSLTRSVRYSKVVEQAVEYGKKYYNKPITLVDAATQISISPNYLSLIFRKEFGVNFTEYITQLRIERAKELLQTTNSKLFEIAEQCGFNDPAYFTKTFKKQEGISPNEFKKRVTGRSL